MNKSKSSIIKVFFKIIAILLVTALSSLLAFTVYCMTVSRESVHTISEYEALYENVLIFESDDGSVTVTSKDNKLSTGIIFYIGAQITPEAYIPLMANLAEKGYQCFVPAISFNLGPMKPNIARHVIDSNPDIDSWILAGHSLGGFTASGFAYMNIDEIDGLVLIGAYTNRDFSSTDLPTLAIYGDHDSVMNKKLYDKRKSWNSKCFEEHIIIGANHSGFGNYGEQPGDTKATISPEEQTREAAEIIDNWIKN